MTEFLLLPPVAFVIYLVLVAILSGFGRVLAGRGHPTALKSSIYASGESQPQASGTPGYGTFFGIALFFAVLHLGALIIGISSGTAMPIIYVAALMLVLAALLLG